MGIASTGDGCAEVEAGTGNQAGHDDTSPAGSDRPVCAEEGGRGPAGDGSEERRRGHGLSECRG